MPSRSNSKRISRLRLALPLGSPYLSAFATSGDEEQQKLVSATGSQWTLSAGPASTGSIYSQESFTNSPIPLRSAKVDKRRFALALQSANLNWDGSWSAPIRDPRSPDAATFVLDLQSATLKPEEEDEFIFNKSEDTLLKKSDTDMPELVGDTAKTEVLVSDGALKATKKDVVSKEVPQIKTKKPRSKSVFEKIFSRRSAHPTLGPFTESSDEEDKPLLPSLPPRIEVTLPSPGIRGVHDMREPEITPADLVRSLQSANIPGNRATMPSGWKPRRPPSPIPKSLRKNGKNGKNGHKRNATSVSPPVAQSPIPPLPPRQPPSVAAAPFAAEEPAGAPIPDTAAILAFEGTQKLRRRSSWTESLQVRVKARAMKSAYYAPVPEGILSPPTSAM